MDGPVPPVHELLATRAGEEPALNDRHLNPQLGRIVRTLGFDRRWVRGEGAHLVDERGERYLDLLCGYGVFNVGRNHPEVADALRDVLDARTATLPQLGTTLLTGVLAEQLLARAPRSLDAMVPASSGTEAVEAAMKLARAATGRPRVLYAEHAFHGLTLGALSLNGNAEFREGFGPLLPGCASVPWGDLGALERELARGDVAALVVEPVQGKGVNLPLPGWLAGAQERCRAAGALFVVDEVQTGLGRTGRFLALEHWDLRPDVVTLAKALSGGHVPVGAVLVSRAVMDAVFDGMERGVRHGSTFGGNDLAAAAGLATLRVLERERLAERAARLGHLLLELTRPLVDRYEIVREVRGIGLMWAIELGEPSGGAARRVWRAAERAQPGIAAQLLAVPLFHEHRILVQVAGHRMNVVKALPALVVEEAEIRRFAAALEAVVADAERLPSAFARFGWRMTRRAAAARRARGAGGAMRALVTGAAGFIGAHVAAALRDAGAEVRGLDLRADGMPDGVEPLVGDVLDRDAVARAVAGCDAVFHLAAIYSYAPRDRAAMRAVNVEGTRVVLDACARARGPRRVVHTSTCATCGPVPGRAATERDAPPRWELKVAYKATKLAGERVALQAAREGHDVVVVNPTTPVGPGDRAPTPTGRMVADVASGRARAHLAGGVLNVVGVGDVAASHLRAFERGRAGERYLLGGENLPIADVFAIVARAAGRRPPRIAVPWAAAYAAAVGAELARRALGREPRLLVLDELRVARLPMAFDDGRARRELGHRSAPAADALRQAAWAFAHRPPPWTARRRAA